MAEMTAERLQRLRRCVIFAQARQDRMRAHGFKSSLRSTFVGLDDVLIDDVADLLTSFDILIAAIKGAETIIESLKPPEIPTND